MGAGHLAAAGDGWRRAAHRARQRPVPIEDDEAAAIAYDLHRRTQVYAAELAPWLVGIHMAEQRGEVGDAAGPSDRLAAVDDHGYLYQALAATGREDEVDPVALAPRLASVLDEPPSWRRPAGRTRSTPSPSRPA